jgi:ATP-binding cassette subfamily F protein 3
MSHTSVVSHFSFGYPHTEQPIITNLSLNLTSNPDPCNIALVASNGVGKTTILNEIWKESFTKSQRVQLAPRRLYLTQHVPQFELDTKEITENYYELLLQELYNLEEYDDKTNEWLLQQIQHPLPQFKHTIGSHLVTFGLNPRELPSQFHRLSPGTRKKVILSIALATEPDLVLADELTNHLDKEAIKVLTQLIKNSSSNWLIVDHNQQFLKEVVRQYVFIPDDNKRKPYHFTGTYQDFQEYLTTFREKEEQELQRVVSQKKQLENKARELESLARQFDESSQVGNMVKSNQRKLDRVASAEILKNKDANKQVNFRSGQKLSRFKKNLLVSTSVNDPLVLKIGSVHQMYIPDFKVYQGSRVQLTGVNGSGKSTLIKYVTRALSHEQEKFTQYISGTIVAQGIPTKSLFRLEQLTNYPEAHNLNQYILNHTEFMEYHIPRFLKSIELDKFSLESSIHQLSLGEFIRLQLGILSARLHDITLIIMDEPGNYLDIYTQRALVTMLQGYKGALLYVTHDDVLAEQIGADIVFDVEQWKQ